MQSASTIMRTGKRTFTGCIVGHRIDKCGEDAMYTRARDSLEIDGVRPIIAIVIQLIRDNLNGRDLVVLKGLKVCYG